MSRQEQAAYVLTHARTHECEVLAIPPFLPRDRLWHAWYLCICFPLSSYVSPFHYHYSPSVQSL